MTRAKKGSTLIKKVKSSPYLITAVLAVNSGTTISIKVDGEFKEIKGTDIPIMDLASTGSALTKRKIESVSIVKELEEIKVSEEKMKNNQRTEETENDDSESTDEEVHEVEELTIDDFIEDFKL